MQEIFNKVGQNQFQVTKNVVYQVYFLNAAKTISISAGSISNRAEMTYGTAPTVKLYLQGWKGGWSCHTCQRGSG